MSFTLEDEFANACNYVQNHASELDERLLLSLYGFFKQTKNGKCDQQEPRMLDFKNRAKWKAWSGLGDMCRSTAMYGYINVLTEAVANWRENSTREALSNWISVSTMPKLNEESAAGVFDWVKDGNFVKVREASKSDLNLKDEHGMSLLHWACDRGHGDTVKYLVEDGKIDVNCRDGGNQTPLHYAAACGHLNICKILLDSGADAKAVDNENLTPMDLAEESVIIQLLSIH